MFLKALRLKLKGMFKVGGINTRVPWLPQHIPKLFVVWVICVKNKETVLEQQFSSACI